MSKLRRVQFDNDDDDELVQASRAIAAEQLAMNPADRVINNDFYVREIARHYPGAFNKLARLDKRLNNLLTGDASRGFRREMMEEQTVKKTRFYDRMVTDDDGVVTWRKEQRDEYLYNGELHRDSDLPAVVETDITVPGKEFVVSETWYRHGVVHRDDGPAEIGYNLDGTVAIKNFVDDGRLHIVERPGIGIRTYYAEDQRPTHTINADGTIENHRLYDEDYGNWDDNDGPEL